MKRVLQIIHSEVADISVISKFFQKKHHTSTIFYKNLFFLKKKELDQFDLFIFHGGKQSANSKSKAIAYEYKFLKHIIKLNKPIIGICLGAQLIAKIYGSKISKAKNKVFECGYKKNLKNNSKVFKKNLSFLQFHTEGISLNKNMELLAKGILYDVDSFKIKNKNIYGFQFHPEVTAHTIKRWHDIVKIKYPYIDNLNKIMKDFKKYQFQNYNWFQGFLLKLLK
jgi:GMP synthase (glutamine-hydrolysing)